MTLQEFPNTPPTMPCLYHYKKLHTVNVLGVLNYFEKLNEYQQTVFLVSSSSK